MNVGPLIAEFSRSYDSDAKDRIWLVQSEQFRQFWSERILSKGTDEISESECDKIIRILDRNGKGNTKDSEAVAKAMIAQGAWRRMLNEFHRNRELGALITEIFNCDEPEQKARLIDKLYKVNEKQANSLTGPSGNAVNALLAAYDPTKNVSVISLKHRRALIEYFGFPISFEWDRTSIGQIIVSSNRVLLEGLHALGLTGSARTVSRFFYFEPFESLWKGEHTVKRPDKSINVTVPTAGDSDDAGGLAKDEVRESMQMQALIAKIGASMGFSIWLPRADRGRVLKVWKAAEGELLDDLPLGYNQTTMKTIEQIDVIWLRKRSIVRAFEVEHTTSVYSGLLRMADLVALQPDINIRLHIVAPALKREKVMQEIQRPVFSLLEGRALSEMCTFLSYDNLKAIGEEKHLAHLSDSVIQDYEEKADST